MQLPTSSSKIPLCPTLPFLLLSSSPQLWCKYILQIYIPPLREEKGIGDFWGETKPEVLSKSSFEGCADSVL